MATKVTLTICLAVYLCCNMTFSMFGPFFPIEAQEKGAPSIIVGGVVSTYPACVIVLSPIFGYYLPKVGVKFCLLAGILLFGGSNILFAFVYWLSGISFTIFSFLMAFVGGIGSSMLQTSIYALIGMLFKGHYGLTMGLTEVVVGIGYAAGPVVAGSLYEIGGFMLPFLVVGSIPVAFIPFLYITITSPKEQMDDETSQLSIRTTGHILKSCVIICLVLSIIIGTMCYSYTTPIFSLFVYNHFHLSIFEIGLIGLIDAATYVVLCLVTGPLYDRLPPKPFIVTGLTLCSIACFLIGPAPYISKPRLWLTLVADGILGMGVALTVSPVYSSLMQEYIMFMYSYLIYGMRLDTRYWSQRSRYPELSNDSIAMFISGIIPAAISSGELIGPLISGGLAEIMSFEECSSLFGELSLAMAILLLAVITLNWFWFAKTVKELDVMQQLEKSTEVTRNYNTFLEDTKDTTWTIL